MIHFQWRHSRGPTYSPRSWKNLFHWNIMRSDPDTDKKSWHQQLMMIAFWCRVVSILLGNCRCLLPLEILISSSDYVACVQPFKLAPLKTRGSYQRSNSFANEHYRKPRVCRMPQGLSSAKHRALGKQGFSVVHASTSSETHYSVLVDKQRVATHIDSH